jgi:hypothetical protein
VRPGADQFRCNGSCTAAKAHVTSGRGSLSGTRIGFPRADGCWGERQARLRSQLPACLGEGLSSIMVHMLSDATRHAGHADILREHLDGSIGITPRGASLVEEDPAGRDAGRAVIEQAARAADPASASSQPR